MKKYLLLLLVSDLLLSNLDAQTDSNARKSSLPLPKPYRQVITENTVTVNGLFKIHKRESRYLFEIKNELLSTELLVVNRITKAAQGAYNPNSRLGYAGDIIGESEIEFVKGPFEKIFLKKLAFYSIADDTTENGLYKSFIRSNEPSIVAAFDIKAYSPDSSGVVIDLTDFINSENEVFLFSPSQSKSGLDLGNYQTDKSYIENILTFPQNVEIRTVKTFLTPLNTIGTKTFEFNSSIVQLPAKAMHPRTEDRRVGYFSTTFKDFDSKPQEVTETAIVNKWRIEPKEEDRSKYLKGELVEPKNPIVFYIDPATPKKWIPYLIQGVNDWQVAFEQAGFKKAIYALPAPDNDSSWSLEDARHNAIIYKPSEFENASGPNIHDPRTGEILESHINWYHNVLKLVHDWYFIQASAIDLSARKMQFSDSLMGHLISYVICHEVGHTLGLKHNFGASSTVPVDSLRNEKWLSRNGLCPSIMDYARFNYVAQPNDGVSIQNLWPKIGVYDKWAIEWAYRWFPPFKTSLDEQTFLNGWVTKNLGEHKNLYYGNELYWFDPRCQAEDLGDDPIKASKLGIENLMRILPNLKNWCYVPNEKNYESFSEMLKQLVDQYKRYLGHVVRIVGGGERDQKTWEQGGKLLSFVPKEKQKQAIAFLRKYIFETPAWMLDSNIFYYSGFEGVYELENIQKDIIGKLISPELLDRMIVAQAYNPSKAYFLGDLFDDLTKACFSEVKKHQSISLTRRNLQKIYCQKLIELIKPDQQGIGALYANRTEISDIPSIIKGQIRMIVAQIQKACPYYKSNVDKMHLQDLVERLKQALEIEPKKS